MGHTDGMVQIGTYDGTPTANLAEFLALLGDPDALRDEGRAAGSNLDEMSPVARAQLYAEIVALQAANNLGEAGVAYGQYVVTAADVTATESVIDTGLGAIGDDNLAVTISRAGAIVTADAGISEALGVITVVDGAATYVLTAGDQITWFVVEPAA